MITPEVSLETFGARGIYRDSQDSGTTASASLANPRKPTFNGVDTITVADIDCLFMLRQATAASSGENPRDFVSKIISDGQGGWLLENPITRAVVDEQWHIGWDDSKAYNDAVAAGGYSLSNKRYLVQYPKGLFNPARNVFQHNDGCIVLGGPPVAPLGGRGSPWQNIDYSSDVANYAGAYVGSVLISGTGSGIHMKCSPAHGDSHAARALKGPAYTYVLSGGAKGFNYDSRMLGAKGFGWSFIGSKDLSIEDSSSVNINGWDNGQDGEHVLAGSSRISFLRNFIYANDDASSITIEGPVAYNAGTSITDISWINCEKHNNGHSGYKCVLGVEGETDFVGTPVPGAPSILRSKWAGGKSVTLMGGWNDQNKNSANGNIAFGVNLGSDRASNPNMHTGSIVDGFVIENEDAMLLWPSSVSQDYLNNKPLQHQLMSGMNPLPGGYQGYDFAFGWFDNVHLLNNRVVSAKRSLFYGIGLTGLVITGNTRRLQDIISPITPVNGQPLINLVDCPGALIQGYNAPGDPIVKSHPSQDYLWIDGVKVM